MERYKKIISMPHHVSLNRRKMSEMERAAQFAPFAALVGYSNAIKEAARLTEKRIEQDDYEIEMLNEKLKLILDDPARTRMNITYFIKDKRKDGGIYVSECDFVKSIDEYSKTVIMRNGKRIPIFDIISIEETFDM